MTTLGRPGTAEGIGSVNTQISSLQGCFDNLVYSLEMEACRLATEKQSLAEERQKVEQAQHESTKRLESLDRLVQAGSAWQRHLDRSSVTPPRPTETRSHPRSTACPPTSGPSAVKILLGLFMNIWFT